MVVVIPSIVPSTALKWIQEKASKRSIRGVEIEFYDHDGELLDKMLHELAFYLVIIKY